MAWSIVDICHLGWDARRRPDFSPGVGSVDGGCWRIFQNGDGMAGGATDFLLDLPYLDFLSGGPDDR